MAGGTAGAEDGAAAAASAEARRVQAGAQSGTGRHLPPAKRRRFSVEPDLEVIVDGGEVFRVDSRRLMRASAVFKQMLESGLREEQEGRVTLHGKSAGELREVLSFVDPPDLAGPPAVSAANVDLLLRWADEYDMEALRDLCEQFLLACPAGDPVLLRVALRYGLVQRTDQCLRAMSANIPGHMRSLREFLHEPKVMEVLGPSICRAARVNVSAEAFSPGGGSLQSLWPFVERAVASGRPRAQRGAGGVVGLAGEVLLLLSLGLTLCELFATLPASAATDAPLEAEIRLCGSLAGVLLGCASVVPVVQAVRMSALVLHREPGPRENWLCALLVSAPGTLAGALAAAGATAAEPVLVAWQIGRLWALLLASSFLVIGVSGQSFARPAWRLLSAFLLAPLAPALGARLLSGEAACGAARELSAWLSA